jgi:hypothetical protein
MFFPVIGVIFIITLLQGSPSPFPSVCAPLAGAMMGDILFT